MPRTVYYVAASADGFIARPDGSVDWLDAFNSPELGYETFLDGVGAVVLGRATWDVMKGFGPWPYGARPALVATTRPLAWMGGEVPASAVAVRPDDLPRAVRELVAATHKDVWIVGGGRTARACLDAGLVDEIELYVVPLLLGAGIPLLAPAAASTRLALVETHAFANGIVRLRHRVG